MPVPGMEKGYGMHGEPTFIALDGIDYTDNAVMHRLAGPQGHERGMLLRRQRGPILMHHLPSGIEGRPSLHLLDREVQDAPGGRVGCDDMPLCVIVDGALRHRLE